VNPRRLHALLVVVALTLIASAVTSCGVPTDDAPVELADERLTELLATEFEAPAVAPTPIAVNFPNDFINVYFIGQENRLAPVRRSVESETASAVLQQLLAGPTEAERDELGYTTAIDAELRVLGVDFIEATVIVDIAGGSTLDSLTGDEAKLAFAQMVYTLTELAPIASFLLRVDGELAGLPTDAGVNDPEEAVLRINYDLCCSPPETVEPTTVSDPDAPVRSTPTPPPATPTPTPDTRPTPTIGAATPEPTTSATPGP